MQRRQWLSHALTLTAALALPCRAGAVASAHPRFAAAWDDAADVHHVGLLQMRDDALQIVTAVEVPSRAHGLLVEPAGTLLAVARRPGDWLLRWNPAGGAPRWFWNEPDRRYTGHLLRAGPWLYSAETDQESGAGLVVCRDAATFAVQAEWATHGIDPHQFILDADGSLLVANGGVPTLAETGRVPRHLERMDPSLVRLDRRSGALLGQWRLTDPRLSIRHLVRDVDSGLVGIALQAEHDDAERKAAAPVLALFDGETLRSVDSARPLAGYGGDIAVSASGFVVSVPRAGGVAHWQRDGRWAGFAAFPEACALVSSGAEVWAAGRGQAADCSAADALAGTKRVPVQLDNHWVLAQAR